MIRRIISIGFIAVMIMSGLVVMDIVPIGNVKAGELNEPTDRGDGVLTNNYGDPDWIITATPPNPVTYLGPRTIILNSNLTIQDGGQLILKDITLIFNGTYDGEFGINVEAGPGNTQLTIQDGGWGGCNITANQPPEVVPPGAPYNFSFKVGSGTDFTMTDSELHYCGWNTSEPDLSDAGLNIQSADAVITNNDISYNFRGILLYGLNARGATITGNTIHDNERSAIYITNATNLPASPTIISDNNIHDQTVGVFLDTVTYVNINDSVGVNNIYNNTNYGVYTFTSSHIIISNNNIDNTYYGVYTSISSNVLISNNNIDNTLNTGVYADTATDLKVSYNNFNNNNNTIYAMLGSDIKIENNLMIGNPTSPGGMGMYIEGIRDGWIGNNTINSTGVQYFHPLYGWQYPRGIWLALGTNTTTAYNNEIYDVNDGLAFSLTSAGTGSGNNVTTNNIHDNTDSLGLIAWGHDSQVYNNEVFGNDYGIIVYGDLEPDPISNPTYNLLVSENNVYDNDPTGTSTDYGGITTESSDYGWGAVYDVTFRHNTIIDNNQLLTNYIGGHHIIDAYDITIIDEIITNNDRNLWAENSIVTVINSTLTKSSAEYDIYLQGSPSRNTNVTTLNTDFDKSSVSIQDANSELTVKWYMHVKVQDGAVGVDGAEVNVYDMRDYPDPTTGQPYTTANGGWVQWIPVTEYIQKQSSQKDYTPHNVWATTSDKEGYANPTMDQTKNVIIDLNTRPTVESLVPSSSNVNRTYKITMKANAHDGTGEDTENYLTPHFEYRVNDTSPWMNESSPYFVAGTKKYQGGEWSIEFQPPKDAPIDTYDFRVRVNDTYPSYSDWFYANNSVNVLNCIPVVKWSDTDPSGTTSVLRGDMIFIVVDGDDIEDGDEQNFDDANAAIFEYNDGSGWKTAYLGTPYKDSTNFRATFTPEASPVKAPLGLYDFRFKFIDNDGNESIWYYNNQWIEVQNNPPVAEDLQSGFSEVYRGQSTWIFANGSDDEDGEDGCTVTFWYDKPGGPSQQWENTYLSDKQWDSAGFWKVLFTPPYTEDNLGLYKFMVNFTDDDGDYDNLDVAGLVEVKNNPPTALTVDASGYGVRAGSGTPIYILVDATDNEDSESLLKVFALADDIQVQAKGSGSWVSRSNWFDASSYVGGQISIPFQPDDTASPGDYYIRVRVTDGDGDKSDYIQMSQAVTIYPPNPDIPVVTPQADEVYRTETIWIHIDAHDELDPEPDLTPHLEYDPPGAQDWSSAYLGDPEYIDTNANLNDDEGYWRISFTPDEFAPVISPGNYEFRAWITTSTGGISEITEDIDLVTVLNNKPEATGISSSASSVNRGDFIYIYGDGTDVEDDEEDLTPTFRWKLEDGSWSTSYFSDYSYVGPGSNSWQAKFSPPVTADDGDYQFQVKFDDDDDSSLYKEGLTVEVANVDPTVENINFQSSGYRQNTINIFANATDPETAENHLTAYFQYQLDEGAWIDIDSQDIAPEGNYWKAEWIPSKDTDTGSYNFRVKFDDDDGGTTDWIESSKTFELKNSLPEVEVTSPPQIQQESAKVDFAIEVSDLEDPNSALTFEWDFDGDEEVDSTEQNPSYTFSKGGNYMVTVRVTDTDGGTTTESIPIVIPEDVGGEDGGGLDMMTLLLILLPLIVVILVLIVLLTRKKKKPEEIPPAAPAAAPAAPAAAPPAAAPPAEVPTAAPAAAVPAAAPTAAPPPAVPAAAPAAPPPAPAGQKIKCPKCGTAFTVESAERPITIECPSCGAKGKLT